MNFLLQLFLDKKLRKNQERNKLPPALIKYKKCNKSSSSPCEENVNAFYAFLSICSFTLSLARISFFPTLLI
tara:strand:+ start:53 stop:268 length:216 start_codon:yes stop_codon:yes gene_type:complete